MFLRIKRYEIHLGTNSVGLRFKTFIYKDNSLSPMEHLFKSMRSIFHFSPLQYIGFALLGIIAIMLFLFFSVSVEDIES
jgi:hypothetical protein